MCSLGYTGADCGGCLPAFRPARGKCVALPLVQGALSTGSTCRDGIRNGDEEGVDCGGRASGCAACVSSAPNGASSTPRGQVRVSLGV